MSRKMSRKMCVFTIIALALAMIPGVHAKSPLENVVVVQDLPEKIVAGSTYEMIITFDNVAQESVTLIVEITVTCKEAPLGYGEVIIEEIKLNNNLLTCTEEYPGGFRTDEGTLVAESSNELRIKVSSLVNLMPGTYTFEIDLLGEEPENKPPVADAGGPYYGRPRVAIAFDGTWSQDPDGTIVSYAWDFGDGAKDVGAKVSHTYEDEGVYTVTLTVTDDDGLTDSDATTATVSRPTPILPPNKKPKADAGPNQKAWVDRTVYFDGTGSSDSDGTIVSWRWSFGDGATTFGETAQHAYSEPGHYTVTLTVRDNMGAEDSDTCMVKVSEPPTTVTNEFTERVSGKNKGHVVDAREETDTILILDTTKDVTVTILRYEANPHPMDPLPATALPRYVDVSVSDPDAVVWPIYVEMTYTSAEVGDLDEFSLGIYYWMDDAWHRCSNTGVDVERNIVWVYMTEEEASGSPILIGGTPPPPPKPAEFILSDLAIAPAEIKPGEEVTISLKVTNVGDLEGSTTVELYINDVKEQSKPVTLAGGSSTTVSFSVTKTTAGSYTVKVGDLTGSFTVKEALPPPPPPPKPAEFEVSDLVVSPGEVVEGESVTVTVKVTNVGEEEGTHTVDLKVDGLVVDSETVTLAGGASATVSFELTRGVGSYIVEVDSLTGRFEVKAPPPPPPPTVSIWLSPGYIAGILIIFAAAVASVYAIYRRGRLNLGASREHGVE
jgi:PKD repeat protein